jgi:uncharacterized protein with GYD domain
MAEDDTRNVREAAIEPVVILLISLTEKGAQLSTEEFDRRQNQVSGFVRNAGGRCQLFQTPGNIYDFVSIVRDISNVAALYELLWHMESEGHFKVRPLLGSDKSLPDRRIYKG